MRFLIVQPSASLAVWLGFVGVLLGASCQDDEPARPAAAGSASAAYDTGAQSSVAPQCARAEGLDGPDAPRSSCKSRRGLLLCEINADSTEVCLSDDLTHCPSDLAPVPLCVSQCEVDEYAVSCGGVGPDSGGALAPEGCRSQGRTPAGPELFCCPCVR